MPKMVCVDDGFEFDIEKNGVFEIVMANFGEYQIFRADLWKCRGCGKEVVAGFGKEPFIEHFDEGFKTALTRVKASRHFYNYGRHGEYKK